MDIVNGYSQVTDMCIFYRGGKTGWVEDFNPSARSGPSRPARQLDGPKYGLARPDPLIRFKKIKNKNN